MRITVLFFGLARDLTGLAHETANVPEGESLRDLWRLYETRFPALSKIGDSLLLAVNQAAEQPSRILQEGDEVAFLPPVSGGAGDRYEITHEAIQTSQIMESISAPEDGAIVVFEGVARNHSAGRKVLLLEYEAYEPMAVRVLSTIGEEANQRFEVSRIGVVHRVGRVEIGQTSVLVVVASPHRAAAFEACRYIIEEVKRRAPVWKKEVLENGSMWVEGESLVPDLAQRAG